MSRPAVLPVVTALLFAARLAAADGAPAAPPAPSGGGISPRALSGTSRADADAADGTVRVRVTYDTMQPEPLGAKVEVALVGYAADGKVSLARQPVDAQGQATFAGLDRTGATAYFALAELPRAGKLDRLASTAIVLGDTGGARVMLSGEKRASKAPPVDDLDVLDKQEQVAAGTLRIALLGAPGKERAITVFDAATGTSIATGTAAGEGDALHVDLAVRTRPGQVVYAEAVSGGQSYRSLPVELLPDRGTRLSIYVVPRLLVSQNVFAKPDATGVSVIAQVVVANNAWLPYAAGPLELPLPKGFANAEVRAGDPGELTATGLVLRRPLQPGSSELRVVFDLAADHDQVAWHQDLPYGLFTGAVDVEADPGVALEVPGETVTRAAGSDGDYLTVAKLMRTPHHELALTIGLPRLTPKQAALARACHSLAPARNAPLKDKSMPALAAPQLDGARLDAAKLRGKPLLVHFFASWDALSDQELPTLAALARARPDLAIVLVASDKDPGAVRAKVGDVRPFRIVLDPPNSTDRASTDNIGPITHAWGTHMLPESYLVDRNGTVRLYFDNARDWSTPDAAACVAAVAAW